MSDGESTPLVVAPANRNRRAMLIGVIALVAVAVVVAVVWLRRGESNDNQSSGDNPTQTEQGTGVPVSNSNSAAAVPSPVQSVTPRANAPERNTQAQTPVEAANVNRASTPNTTARKPNAPASNPPTSVKRTQDRGAAERRKRALGVLDQP